MKKQNGFTLIELMLSIVIIGVLSRIAFQVINVQQQKNRAQDSVNLSNLEKAALAIEAYYYSQGNYPEPSTAANKDPTQNLVANKVISEYIKTWPGTNFYYAVDASPPTLFAVYVIKNVGGGYYKYISTNAKVMICKNTAAEILNASVCTE